MGASAFLFHDLRAVRKHGVKIGNHLDEYHLLARRAFLTLVTMERWNAAGVSAQTIIPEDLTKLVAADKMLLGGLGYNALRKCSPWDHIVWSERDFVIAPWQLLYGIREIDRFPLE